MPRQIHEIKEFLTIINGKHVKDVRIKKNRDNTKFKVKRSCGLVTLVVTEAEKAEKLIKMIPPTLKPRYIKPKN